ncbi:hypothetical protein [Pseudomonas sp. LRF_L74]|uniref:hypothetical protein n=1 Tax=Pseudomonas sp. LRF_L74 TaxID=3369422 RepID=UPI003F60556D
MAWAAAVPAWCWWILALLAVGGGQQVRVVYLQHELVQLQAKQQDTNDKLVACRETRSTLLVQVGEQNAALADLRAAGEARAAEAELVQAQARTEAEADYQAANRLQQERTGGDACAAAESVIDRELGL